jgi:hypothetical protein
MGETGDLFKKRNVFTQYPVGACIVLHTSRTCAWGNCTRARLVLLLRGVM